MRTTSTTMRSPRRTRGWFAAAAALWVGAIAVGFAATWVYSLFTGTPAAAPRGWPSDCAIERREPLPTLLVFAHPHCPCTRATINELERIATRCACRVQIVATFLELPELGDEWTRSDLWRRAASIPGVEVRADRGGAIARSFGVETSGQTLLYDAGGALVFAGGITGSRGHAGDNDGEDAVLAFVLDGRVPHVTTPVFGCGLTGEPQ
jgi:hypothetical protein